MNNNVRTLSDTKRAFYQHHARPISSVYRRVVEELLVEMHLLSVNVDFAEDPVYALGVVSSFDRFMEGYKPERDRDSIFQAICRAVEADPDRYRQDAARLEAAAAETDADALQAALGDRQQWDRLPPALKEAIAAVADRPNFKYSRLFAVGLFCLFERADADLVKDDARQQAIAQAAAEQLGLPAEKLRKDLELFRSNLEKMAQARTTLEEMVAAEQKKRAQRERDRQQAAEGAKADDTAAPASSTASADDTPAS